MLVLEPGRARAWLEDVWGETRAGPGADFSRLVPRSPTDGSNEDLLDIDVGLLVNNVGISYDFCQWFHELSDTEVASPQSTHTRTHSPRAPSTHAPARRAPPRRRWRT